MVQNACNEKHYNKKVMINEIKEDNKTMKTIFDYKKMLAEENLLTMEMRGLQILRRKLQTFPIIH